MRTGVLEQIYSRLPSSVNATAQAALGLVLLAAAGPAAPPTGIAPSAGCDPRLTRLFTPPHPRVGHYEVCTTGEDLAAVARPDWTIDAISPLDAFGSGGPFNRAALSRLYGGRQARIARGWQEAGGDFESFTLISPYPDPTLSRLEPGTLIIRWTLCCP
jgi:hypothetical protein